MANETDSKVAFTKAIIGDASVSDDTVGIYLKIAEEQILDRLYPFGAPENATVPARYETLHCQLASRLFFRKGVEGQLLDIEGDIHRHYESVDDDDIMKRIVPYAKVM